MKRVQLATVRGGVQVRGWKYLNNLNSGSGEETWQPWYVLMETTQ